MSRIITAAMADAIRARRPLALLCMVDHPSGLVYFWTGVGDLIVGGITWRGAGVLGSIVPIKKTNDLAIQQVQMTLSGVPPETATWLSANVRNRAATVWLVCLDEYGNVVPNPLQLVNLVMDYQTFTVDDNGVASIVINALSGFYTLERALKEIWSEQDQLTRYPTDTGFNQLTLLQNQEVKWTAT